MLKNNSDDVRLSPPGSTASFSIQSRHIPTVSEDFHLLGAVIAAGERRKLNYCFDKINESFTVFVVNGRYPGPVICLTAAIHGDELNGIEIVRRVMDDLDPDTLSGVVVGIPIINLEGYEAGGRYMGDHFDLNRCFPGTVDGLFHYRFAYGIFNDIILLCDALVDIHTGSSLRENHPQLRADLSVANIAALANGMGSLSVLQNIAPEGSLRKAATIAGLPALVMEVGSSLNLEPDKILVGVQALKDLLQQSGMTAVDHLISTEHHIYLGSGWVRAEFGGMLINSVELGAIVHAGDVLAEIIDPMTSEIHKVIAPCLCTILSRAHNQHIVRGFGLFRVGIE